MFQVLGIPGQVAVDGKTIRGSRRKTTDKSVVHMVSALCCESLVCGQIRTGEKTNEIGVFGNQVPSGERFTGLNTLIQVESRVEKKNGNQILEETRYYVSSRKMTAVAVQEAVRNHWHVENRLHWVLDMTFSEDHCRTRTEHAAENLSVIRHFAINVLRNYQGDRHSFRRRRRLRNYKRDYWYLVLSAAAMS